MPDHRSPLARARDDWFESEEGKKALGVTILLNPEQQEFLKNRLETAFLAGAEVGRRLTEYKLADKIAALIRKALKE